MIRRFFRHIKEGFFGVGRHLGMALSSASAVTITLIIIGIFIVITLNLYEVTKSIEGSISIVATIKDEYDSDHLAIQERIDKIDGVDSIIYHTKDQEFDYYLDTMGDDSLREFYESYRDDNPFKAAFIIYTDDGNKIESIKTQLDDMIEIDSTSDGGSNTYVLVGVLDHVRVVGGILVVALIILAMYLIYNTIKITIASRSDEIWIMRNVGAKNGYVRAPFLVEGIIIGFLGSVIPMLAAVFGYIYLYQSVSGRLFGAFVLIEPHPFVLYVAGLLLAIGIVVGFVGSYISVFKYLRLKR